MAVLKELCWKDLFYNGENIEQQFQGKNYTGHCFGRSAATLLINSGGEFLQLMRLRGCKSSTVAEEYTNRFSDYLLKIARRKSGEVPKPSTAQNDQHGLTISATA